MRLAALNTGPDFHLLDHIAPLACLLQMPLYIEEEKNFTLSSQYYPMVETHFLPEIDHHLPFFAENYDTLFECKYWAPHLKRLFLDLYKKEMRLIFCSHGQSDKGYATPLLLPYSTQEYALVYGDLLKNMLSEMKVSTQLIYTGNYRLLFYQMNRPFYDHLVEKEGFSRFPLNQKTVLYAPTWNDADGSTSFFKNADSLCSSFPDDWNLIVKVHPLLELRDPAQYYRIAALVEAKPNRLLLSEFPLIYPLLARADIYLGDYSSVGYDFLFFQRPMFFLLNPHLPKGKLHACGTVLKRPEDLMSEIEINRDFSTEQKNLYNHSFNTKNK
jgi:CDP-glycerol glycerophosphotransferase (TagB/SpsB family)